MLDDQHLVPCARRIMNEGKEPFDFSAALHSYFEVLDVEKAKVRGLKGLTFLDKSDDPTNPVEAVEERDEVTFGSKLVDSVYKDAPEFVELDVGTGALFASCLLFLLQPENVSEMFDPE